ncbi:hypothetical protein U1Q18_010649 [Sarracenia purpurea var. burkii]
MPGGRARPSITRLYNWRYRDLGDLPYVKEEAIFHRANAGFSYEYQLVDVLDYHGRGEIAPSPWFYQNIGEAEYIIHHLAVDALLKSNQVNEMEGGALFGFEQDLNPGHFSNEQCFFDEVISCAPSFRVLKQLVQICLTNALTSGNVFADAISSIYTDGFPVIVCMVKCYCG